MVVGNDPPSGLGEEGVIGGFKICISDAHQVIYGADSEGLCEFKSFILLCYCHCCLGWQKRGI